MSKLEFIDRVPFGSGFKTVVTDDLGLSEKIKDRCEGMNKRLNGEGTFRIRQAEQKRGKSGRTVDYIEFIKYVDKLPFDNSDYGNTMVSMRVSQQTEPDIPEFPYFIAATQCWHWYDRENGVNYFYDDLTDPKNPEWKKGEYDSASYEWTEIK